MIEPKIEYTKDYAKNPRTISFGKYHGRMFAIRMFRNPLVYIEIKEGEDYKMIVTFLSPFVHGGVSYDYEDYPSVENTTNKWIGWDYGHACDFTLFASGDTSEGKKYTYEEVMNDIKEAIELINRTVYKK